MLAKDVFSMAKNTLCCCVILVSWWAMGAGKSREEPCNLTTTDLEGIQPQPCTNYSYIARSIYNCTVWYYNGFHYTDSQNSIWVVIDNSSDGVETKLVNEPLSTEQSPSPGTIWLDSNSIVADMIPCRACGPPCTLPSWTCGSPWAITTICPGHSSQGALWGTLPAQYRGAPSRALRALVGATHCIHNVPS